MIFNNINTNLAGSDFQKLKDGEWEIGYFKDNPSLKNVYSNCFKDYTNRFGARKRIIKIKIEVILLNKTKKFAHIIHWDKNEGYFCITNDIFWDQLKD